MVWSSLKGPRGDRHPFHIDTPTDMSKCSYPNTFSHLGLLLGVLVHTVREDGSIAVVFECARWRSSVRHTVGREISNNSASSVMVARRRRAV
jgi:hypothetical protein